MRAVFTLFFLYAAGASAQSIDSIALIDTSVVRAATDSKGNAVVVQEMTSTIPCTGCFVPAFISVYRVARYASDGKLIDKLTDQTVGKSARVAFLGVDRLDNIYVGSSDNQGGAILIRPSDPPFTRHWTSEISGTPLDLRAIAFDADNQPILMGTDRNAATLNIRVIKLDRTSGRILAQGRFGTPYDTPVAMALDAAGNVYITGSTFSASFPVTGGGDGSLATDCGPPDDRGRSSCSAGFVTRLKHRSSRFRIPCC